MYAFENAIFQLNRKEYHIAVKKKNQEHLRTINAAIGWCIPHIVLCLAWCSVYVRASFNFTLTLDAATEPEDITSVISEKSNS